jgi:type VI secretion system protein ImpL
MKAILSSLRTVPGIAGLLGTLLISALIWFFAPAVLGVSRWWALLMLAAVPPLVWVVVILLMARRAQKRDAALVAGATEIDERVAKANAHAEAAKDEESAVASRLSEALRTLKTAGGGKGGYLYERPWYVLIGPPGSGKTTAIRNSGLTFPLAEGRVSGVGGTRNCDWWIAEQAVLIDTAGRYTTQDSDAQVDKAGWSRFLDLLRRERADQPLNGVIVAFGADLLCRLDAPSREQHARTVRQRVRELEERLGQRLPVYLLVSKCDLLSGFTEFFDNLDAESRRQVWGVSFDAKATAEGPVGGFRTEFKALLNRLQDRLLERLQTERGAEQRAAIAGFGAQFASLEEPVDAFLQAAFGGSKLDAAPYLRGVYFTSGTQEGTPIDRLTGAMSRTFGLDARRAASLMGQKGRSYFLGRLLLDVVFNEARLAARDKGSDKRRRVAMAGVVAGSALLLLVGAAWAWFAAGRESARAERVAGATGAAEQAVQTLVKTQPLERVGAGSDLVAVLPYLDSTRSLAAAAAGAGGGLGLSQEAKLDTAATVAYRHALDRVLLPRLLARLEGQIRGQMQQPAYLYLATRVYLMLGREGPMDAALIQEWMAADWAQAYPGAVNGTVREQLAAHLGALLEQSSEKYALDGTLVDSARRVFSRLPMDERIYARLRSTATDVAPWKPADALGPSGQRLFVLKSGRPLSEAAVPGLFTVEGLHRSFLPRLPKGIKEAASELWVLGPEGAAQLADPQQLESAVLRRYAQDYVTEWQQLLDSLTLAPLGTPVQAAEALNLLGAPNSPLRDLLRGVSRQLTPAVAPPSAAASAAGALANAASAAMATATGGASSRVSEAMGVKPATNPANAVAEIVDARFRLLREASGPGLDPVLAALNELYTQVAKVATAAPGSLGAAPSTGLDAGQRLAAEAQRAPEPLASWLKTLDQGSSSVRAGGLKAGLAAAAGQQLKPFCQDAESRFPFNRAATAIDMPMGDFARLFGPGGALDQFFSQNLREMVDTSQRVWKPVAAAGGQPAVSAADVAQFQRAAAIRNAFFPTAAPGQAGGTLRFDLVPLGGTGATLSIDGASPTAIAAGLAPGRPFVLQWPATGRLVLGFDGEPASSAWTQDGPWAALRFVMRGRLQATNVPDRMRLTVQQGRGTVEFELRASSIVHPFNMPELAEFRCPRLAP